MSIVAGVLKVLGVYDGRKYDKPLDKSRAKTKLHKKEVAGLAGQMRGYAAMLGGALLIGGARSFVANQLDQIDVLAKTSRRLGLTTEALGAYQHAAGLSGLSSAQLTTAIEKMQDTIGAAAMGEAGPGRALAALGLDPKALSQASDPLERIQRAVAKIGDQNTKLSVMRDIFGRGGAQVLNLYETNLAGVRKEYEAMGLAVSSEEAARIEEFNDKLSVLGQQFSAVGRNLVIDVTPAAITALEQTKIVLEELGIARGTDNATMREQAKRAAKGQRSFGQIGMDATALSVFGPVGIAAAFMGASRQQGANALGEVGGAVMSARDDRYAYATNESIQARQTGFLKDIRDQQKRMADAAAKQRAVVISPAGFSGAP